MQNPLFKVLAAASICSSLFTHAVNISSDGTGEALIYPYYSTRNGNATLITVVNGDTRGKAVKVRFREGRNGADVLDFNLFLSGSDVWTAALVPDTSGAAKLITADLSCTNPKIPQVGVPFRNIDYRTDAPALQGVERTAEGYLEVIEMASIVPNSTVERDVAAKPCSPTALSNSSVANRQNEFEAPRGKLLGSGTLVSSSMSTGYSALALQGLDLPTLVTASGVLSPNLSSGRSKTAMITEATPKRTYTMFAEFDRSIDAVSAVLMQDTIRGEFSQEPGITTDFVMTFPTKHLYVNNSNLGPFTSRWDRATGEACETDRGFSPFGLGIGFASREGERGDDGTYGNGYYTKLCFSATTMSFIGSGASSPLSSMLRAPIIDAGGIDSNFFPINGAAILNLVGRRMQANASSPAPDLQSNGNSRVIVTEPGVATREINGPVKFYGLPVIGIGISSAQFSNSRENYNSSYNLTGGRVLPE